MLKYDIINMLGRRYGLQRYLEICTPTTGVRFLNVAAEVFPVRDRLMYRCPEGFDDGGPIIFKTAAESPADIIRTMDSVLSDQRYDLVFVDSWHSYASSIADMLGAMCLLKEDGIIVAHDCNPTNPDSVTPDFRAGEWCGWTFKAFVDFALAAPNAGFLTVDCDYGCGVIFGAGATDLPDQARRRPSRRLSYDWAVAKEDSSTLFPFFVQNSHRLLNMISPDAFAEAMATAHEPASPADAASEPPSTADQISTTIMETEGQLAEGSPDTALMAGDETPTVDDQGSTLLDSPESSPQPPGIMPQAHLEPANQESTDSAVSPTTTTIEQ